VLAVVLGLLIAYVALRVICRASCADVAVLILAIGLAVAWTLYRPRPASIEFLSRLRSSVRADGDAFSLGSRRGCPAPAPVWPAARLGRFAMLRWKVGPPSFSRAPLR